MVALGFVEVRYQCSVAKIEVEQTSYQGEMFLYVFELIVRITSRLAW